MAWLYVIPVNAVTILEDEHDFMLAAIERSHAGVVFCPSADVHKFGIDVASCGKQFTHVPPIHADVMQGAVAAVLSQIVENL